MSFGFKDYRADEVSAILAGIILKGFAEDTFIKITQDSDSFGDVVGVDREVSRFATGDLRATCEFSLMQTSESNDLLSALHQRDVNTPGGVGVGDFLVRDRQGRALYQADKSWIAKPPDVEFGRAPGPRVWKIRIVKFATRIDGGN